MGAGHTGPSEGSEEAGPAAALGALHTAHAPSSQPEALAYHPSVCSAGCPTEGGSEQEPRWGPPSPIWGLQRLPEGHCPTGRLGRGPFQAYGASMAEP